MASSRVDPQCAPSIATSWPGRKHLVAGGIATAVAGLIVLVPPHLGELLTMDIWGRLGRSVSPHRFAHLLGLDDKKLTYFHGGRFKQLSQFGGKVIKELVG